MFHLNISRLVQDDYRSKDMHTAVNQTCFTLSRLLVLPVKMHTHVTYAFTVLARSCEYVPATHASLCTCLISSKITLYPSQRCLALVYCDENFLTCLFSCDMTFTISVYPLSAKFYQTIHIPPTLSLRAIGANSVLRIRSCCSMNDIEL
jgi:hypothetical protein